MISASVYEEINRKPKGDIKSSKAREIYRQACRTINSTEDDGSSDCIEELWSFGNKLEWKRAGKLVLSFSTEGDILQALWANFLPDLKCIVIREAKRLRIFAEAGEEYLVPLPFQLKKIWNTRFGLLLERDSGLAVSALNPYLLVLHHPLDDLTRVVVHQKSGYSSVEWKSDDQRIILTAKDPSICMTYDSELGQHRIWSLRESNADDLVNLELDDHVQTPLHGTQPLVGTVGPNGSVGGRSQNHTQQTSFQMSNSLLSSQSTPQNSLSKSSVFSGRSTPQQSANITPILMTSSAAHTPLTSLAAISRSPSTSVAHGYLPSRMTSHGGTPITSQSMLAYHSRDEPLPMDFTVCFELLWSDMSSVSQPANKGFLAKDVLGQTYICYLVSQKEILRCLGYMISDDSHITFGNSFQLSCIDAASIEALGMILTMDPGRQNLTLHSGSIKVARVYFQPSPNMQMAHIAHEIAGLRIDVTTWQSNRHDISEADVKTSTRPASAIDPMFDDSFAMSPVRSGAGKKPQVECLDPEVVSTQVMLHYDNGVSLRLGLPQVASSSLVRSCLKALRIYLPREPSLQGLA